uniref:Palmdelphin n=1 Tax=Astyanax mexicanus TaxID=7994 RepID=A0A8B9GXQ1_ASTMX
MITCYLTVQNTAQCIVAPCSLFAMEINVQKDLRTGESRVISTSTVSTQELQNRGIKVYDDGRKSVYALRSDAIQPGANGVDELSPTEVEELLREQGSSIQHELQPLTLTSGQAPPRPVHEPVTMIFMGYQTAEGECTDSYEGSVRAELVVIGDEEEGHSARPHQSHQNCNANNASQHQLQATGGAKGSKKSTKLKGKHKRCCMLM